MGRKLHTFEGSRRLPPEEVLRLVNLMEQRGETVPRCRGGCGTVLIGRRPQTKWCDNDACRKRAERKAKRDG